MGYLLNKKKLYHINLSLNTSISVCSLSGSAFCLVCRMFTIGPGGPGSYPCQVLPKGIKSCCALKMHSHQTVFCLVPWKVFGGYLLVCRIYSLMHSKPHWKDLQYYSLIRCFKLVVVIKYRCYIKDLNRPNIRNSTTTTYFLCNISDILKHLRLLVSSY